jgi:O-antigen/teichoic acid export membrane protein
VVAVKLPRWRKSLTVNAASLMTATVVTNALGLVFWVLAARVKSPVIVGRAAAAVAALTLLATISQLNLTNIFIRLLPTAGRLCAILIRRAYLTVAGVALVISAVFVLSGAGARVVTGGREAQVCFALGVAVLAIFALQDSVLTGLRLAPWVPVENVSFAAAKLLLLPLLVMVAAPGAIVVAWVVPAAVAVVVVTRLLFTRILPSLRAVEGRLPDRRRLISFVAGEYVGNVFTTATVQLMPLLVLWQLGAAQAAFFTLPWLICMGITFLLWNVASSFVVETAGAHGHPDALLRRSLLLWAGVAFGAMLVCVLGAQPLLALAGPRYAASGAPLLRLIGLSAPFAALVAVYSTLAWLDQRVWLLAAIQGAAGAMMLGLTLLLLPRVGLVAGGWANLATQALAAAVMAPLAVRRVRRGRLVEAV